MFCHPLRRMGGPTDCLGTHPDLPACTHLPAPLQMTTATRGAFLIQASILFTPLLASLAGMAPTRWVSGWLVRV